MALETAPSQGNNAFIRNHTQNATIAASGTTSDEIILGGRGVVTIHLPAMDACYISYLVKINPGDTAVTLVDDSNSTLTFPRGASATVTTARVYQEPRLSGIYSVQLVASASQTGGARTIGISARGQNPVPTVTDIEATIVSGATVTANQGLKNGGAAASWYVQGADAHDAAVTGAPMLAGAIGASSPPTGVTTGRVARLWATLNGALTSALVTITGDSLTNDTLDTVKVEPIPSSASTNGLSNANSTSYAASLVIKASPGRLYGCSGYNSKATAQFIQLFNATSLPGGGGQSVVDFSVPAQSNYSVSFGQYGRYFSTGIVAGNSSTNPTLTTGSADCSFSATYL